MTTQIFAVYDSKANAYMEPWFTSTTQIATRAFGNAANDRDHPFAKNPEDYTLFHIGEWNAQTGELTQFATKLSVGLALEYKTQQEFNYTERTNLKFELDQPEKTNGA